MLKGACLWNTCLGLEQARHHLPSFPIHPQEPFKYKSLRSANSGAPEELKARTPQKNRNKLGTKSKPPIQTAIQKKKDTRQSKPIQTARGDTRHSIPKKKDQPRKATARATPGERTERRAGPMQQLNERLSWIRGISRRKKGEALGIRLLVGWL